MNVIQGNGFVADIIRSPKRKTAAIKIQKGRVVVMVPDFLKLPAIESIVSSKTRWIQEKLAIQNEMIAIPVKQFIAGEHFSCLGTDYTLKLISGAYPALSVLQTELEVTMPDNIVNKAIVIKQLLTQWYKRGAESELKRKTEAYARIIGVTPKDITIKTFKARWGSCSSSGSLYYNWKIMMAPESVVDYVVIHELCHLLHHNHAPAYWQTVAKYCPDYRACHAWLKANGGRLEL